MADLKIDYSLKSTNIITFPFAPVYGLRHLKKAGWQNKLIGVIELFPILGPIVAIIEGAMARVFRGKTAPPPKMNLSLKHLKIISKNFKKTETFKKVQAFRKKAIANSKNAKKTDTSSFDLTLKPEDKVTLTKVVAELNKPNIPKNIQLHSANGIFVFSVNEIPGMIFKTKQPFFDVGANFTKRMEDTKKAKVVIDSENLNFLHVPKQEIQKVEIEGKEVEVLIEEKFDLFQGYRDQKSLFQYCIHDKDLEPFIEECTRQLIILIAKTGYSDVRYDNNPLLATGAGLALIDFDTSSSSVTGLVTGRGKGGDDGILMCITPKMIDKFKPLLKKELSPEDFANLKLSEIKKKNQKAAEINRGFINYLAEHQFATTSEKVKFKGLAPSGTYENRYYKDLEKEINQIASKNLGLCPVDERMFYICDTLQESYLNHLKAKGKIFEWTENPNSGFYVWC